ncbi:hypothetical protein THOG10_550002 [Vibrio rotiferianus]|nr:hypothetical protein THOG10_550002 [Vibrio rotiferianus]
MSNASTKPNNTALNTKPNDGMKNAKRWESVLNALLGLKLNRDDELLNPTWHQVSLSNCW